ncbi:Organic radical activating enzyme [Prevotella sp. tc2-28]|uniref:7-carboxy-7-deazaguanine synthase QueE n=1 Tax=Prevotella sp. tc2-28 TaxID=1761888 RepID=UPI0008955F38|nr:7-carboxy-7-deazaguanine synthase QueE [Prevotella sp. tc2-28]SEA80882.1 Organic radical activating enzyme [Prevotella sp. tc2-28]
MNMIEKEYMVNEIFYSLQGEGRWAGRAAIFIRFSGCNLKCPFCDTDFASYKKMKAKDILKELLEYSQCNFVVLTGGEPTLQVTEDFVDMLHANGYYVAMETNATREVPRNINWITASPKKAYVSGGSVWLTKADEVKVVYDAVQEPDAFGISAKEYYIQPCDTGDKEMNDYIIKKCVEWVKNHPKWKLSLQQQKILKVR